MEPEITDPVDPNDPPKDPPVTDPPPAEFAKAEDVSAMRAELSGFKESISLLKETLIANRAPQSVTEPLPQLSHVEDNVSDEELEQLLADGKGASKFRQMVRSESGQRTRALEQRLNDMQANIDNTLALHGGRIADADTTGMPYRNDPRFKKLIDAGVNAFPKNLRARPDIIKAVHDRVVGENVKLVIEAERETALRAARGTPDGTPPPGGGAGARLGLTPAGELPTVLELLGEDAEATLIAKSQSPDEFSRKLGYKGGWADYAAVIQKQKEEGYM